MGQLYHCHLVTVTYFSHPLLVILEHCPLGWVTQEQPYLHPVIAVHLVTQGHFHSELGNQAGYHTLKESQVGSASV